MRVGSLFSGIGGFDLGFERAGMSIAWQCEIEPFARAVLRKHWPDVPLYEDVRSVHGHAVGPVDVLCGGWPCQTFSSAARGRNNHPDMWPEMLRIVRELRPRWVVAENVPQALHGIDGACSSLCESGYACGALDLDVALPTRQRGRYRAIIVAHANGNRQSLGAFDEALAGVFSITDACSSTMPYIVGMANGIPYRMDRMRCLGNAIPPYIAEAIGRAIIRCDSLE